MYKKYDKTIQVLLDDCENFMIAYNFDDEVEDKVEDGKKVLDLIESMIYFTEKCNPNAHEKRVIEAIKCNLVVCRDNLNIEGFYDCRETIDMITESIAELHELPKR